MDMNNRGIIDSYYKHANAGDWTAWCDLFADAMVMDEQLGGHIEGLAKLREMMKGMGAAYAKFQNLPLEIVVEGNKGAVKSHISARAARFPGEPIESDVMNFFVFEKGKISYMSNHHDSRPFAPFLRQLSLS
jgi:ketosteroid isomerase-like protein